MAVVADEAENRAPKIKKPKRMINKNGDDK